MSGEELRAGVDAFASFAQSLQHAAITHRVKKAYIRDIKPLLVGKIKPGEGALLFLSTFEPKAWNFSMVPRQIIFDYLTLVGIGNNPEAMRAEFERQPKLESLPPNTMMKRVGRYIWLPEKDIDRW